MRDLSYHANYRIGMELSKLTEVVRRSLGHVDIATQLPVAYLTNLDTFHQ